MDNLESVFGHQSALGEKIKFKVFPRFGSARWLLEDRFDRPWHLKTWPRANNRARIIYLIAWGLAGIGVNLPFRRLEVTVVDGSPYKQLSDEFDELGLFLGTMGPNRKVVVYAKNTDGSWFVKVPISPASEVLVCAEAAAMSAVGSDLAPKHRWIGKSLAIEDVATHGTAYRSLGNAEIIRVHSVLLERSKCTLALRDVASEWVGVSDDTYTVGGAKSCVEIEDARLSALRYLREFDLDIPLDCYMAHGDFTRWNVLRGKNGTAKIIDWELFGLRTKFFDPFHYVVSQAVLVDRRTPAEILKSSLVFEAEFDDRDAFYLYFGMYIASQTLDYCSVFDFQPVLHDQAYWQLKTWKDLLIELKRLRKLSSRNGSVVLANDTKDEA